MPAATNIPITATTTGFQAAVRAAQTVVLQFQNQLNTGLAQGFRVADRDQRLFDAGLGRVAKNIKSTGQNLSTYLTLPLLGAAGASVRAASQMEQAGVSFRVLLKDANLAAKTVNDLKAFAASTPFEFTDVQDGAKQLLSYGFAVGNVKTLLTDAGNLASGFGVKITDVTRALGRIKAGDFGEGFERLRDFGIGKDVLQAQGLKFDKSGQYQGSVKQAFDAIQTIIHDRFGGQMEEQSKTIGGIFSNLKDQGSFALSELGQKLVDTFNLKGAASGLVSTIATIRSGFNSLPEPIQKISLYIGAAAAATGPLAYGLGAALKALPTLTSGFTALFSTTGLIAGAVVGIVALGFALYQATKPVVDLTSKTELLSSVNKTATDSILSERVELDRLYKVASDETRSKGERLKAIQKLNQISPEYLGFINLENINSDKAAQAVYKHGEAILYRAKARAAEDKLTELAKKRLETEQRPREDFEKPLEFKFNKVTGQQEIISPKEIQERAQQYKNDAIIAIDKNINEIEQYIDLNNRRAGRRGIKLDVPVTVNAPLTGLSTANNGSTGKSATASSATKELSDLAIAKRFEKSLETQIQNARGKVDPALIQQLHDIRGYIEDIEALTSKNQKFTITGLAEIASNATKERVAGIVEAITKVKQITPALFANTGIGQFLSVFQQGRPTLEFYQNKIEEIRRTIAELANQGFTDKSPQIKKLIAQLAELKKALKDATGASDAADAATDSGAEGEENKKYIDKANARIAAMKAQGKEVKQTAEEMANDMKKAAEFLKGQAVQVLEAVGEGLSQGQNPLKVALQTLLGFLGDYMIKIGSALVIGGTALTAAEAAAPFLAPLFNIKGPAALLAGGALVVGGGVVKGLAAQNFAKGGVWDSDTTGYYRFAEYAGSSINQEIATPQRLMGSVMRTELDDYSNRLGNGGSQKMHVTVGGEFKLSGRDLRIALRRQEESDGVYHP